jgi:hypothetical protein
MTKARDLANAADVLDDVSATELSYVNGVTSDIQTQLDAKVAKSLVDAKGDLLVGTANDTVGRLAVASTAGWLLSVDSSETTGLKWAEPSAGAYTLLATATPSNSSTVTFSSISNSYTHLFIYYTKTYLSSTSAYARFFLNNDTAQRYQYHGVGLATSSTLNGFGYNQQSYVGQGQANGIIGKTENAGFSMSRGVLWIYRYGLTGTGKFFSYQTGASNYYLNALLVNGYADIQDDPINRIDIEGVSGNITGTFYLYGVK